MLGFSIENPENTGELSPLGVEILSANTLCNLAVTIEAKSHRPIPPDDYMSFGLP
jgi:hypothetical protein